MAKIKPLKKSKYLKGFSNKEVAILSQIVEERKLAGGETVFEEEAAADALFIVGKGSVQLSTHLNGTQDAELTTLNQPGDSFGELALLGEGSRAVSARALEDAQVLVIPRARFEEFCSDHPAVAAKFLQAVAREVGRVARATAPHVKTLLALKRQAEGQ